MTSLAHTPPLYELRTVDRQRTSSRTSLRLRLVQSGDGWALVGPDGVVVFRALGTRGRRECLEFARAHGVLALLG